MKRFVVLFLFVIAMSGCFWASGSVHGEGMEYSARGLNAPDPMEMSVADLTSAQADMVRAQARTMEAHPELLRGYGGYGGYGGWGYGGYGGAVDQSYWYRPVYGPPSVAPTSSPPTQGSGASGQPPAETQSRRHRGGSQP
jgi:hypothetical protein